MDPEHTDPADHWVGAVIAERYRLTRKLGEGGMGAVYCADHVTLRKRVAVKLLHPKYADDKELVARFEREAMSAANLEHPNIVAATDFGKLPDGTLFLVMEYAEGASLRQRMHDSGKMPAASALGILRQIGAALTRAHSLDVVHRDLKPENVVVIPARDGVAEIVKVIDFGIARVRSSTFGGGATALTQLGSVFGTPAYMAPEQAMGQVVDARADQYALGVIAFELLAGRPPYEAPEMIDVMQMHVGAPIPRLSALCPEFDIGVDAVFDKFLGKLPRERFDSVAEALAALESALAAPLQATAPIPVIARSAGTVTLRGITDRLLLATAKLPDGVRIALAAAVAFAVILVVVASRPPSTMQFAARATVIAPTGIASSTGMDSITPPAQPPPSVDQGTRSAAAGVLADGVLQWRLGHNRDAVPRISQALAMDPSLAEDPGLQQLLAESLDDGGGRWGIQVLLATTGLGRSPAFVGAIAARGLEADRRESGRILRLLRNHSAFLAPPEALRIGLRQARDCDVLDGLLTALEQTTTGPGRDEARRVRAGDCEFVNRRLCERCLGHRGGHEEDDEN